MFVLLISVKIDKIKFTISYKANLKFFQYIVGRPTCTVATFKKFRLALSKPDIYSETPHICKKLQEKICSLLQNKSEIYPIWCYRPICTVETFKEFRLALSKSDIYSETPHICKKLQEKICSLLQNKSEIYRIWCYWPMCKFATISIFGYYMTVHFPILYDTLVSNTIWYYSFGYYMTIQFRII